MAGQLAVARCVGHLRCLASDVRYLAERAFTLIENGLAGDARKNDQA